MRDWIKHIPAWLQTYGHTANVIAGFLTTAIGTIWIGVKKIRSIVRSAEEHGSSIKQADLNAVETRLTVRMDQLHEDVSQIRTDFSHTRQVLDTILLKGLHNG